MIKGIIFDYGATLDTDGLHWSEVIWKGYQASGVRISKEVFRKAYVHGERTLARFPLIQPNHNFLDLMKVKINVQTAFLLDAGFWMEMDKQEAARVELSNEIALFCYEFVKENLKKSRKVVQAMAKKYPLCLVSNFYGNIETILHDFRLDVFSHVVESAVVGVRKPNPQIFSLGVQALGLKPEETVVVGDSYEKDIIPASSIGCHTVWLKGKGWDDGAEEDGSRATAQISSITQLLDAVKSLE